MTAAQSAIAWLALPAVVPLVAWLILHRRARSRPNDKVGLVESDLQRMRASLSESNPAERGQHRD